MAFFKRLVWTCTVTMIVDSARRGESKEGASLAEKTLASEAVDASETAKAKLLDQEGIRGDQQHLLSEGTQLEDGRMLSDSDVQKESTRRLSGPLKFSVKGPSGTTITLEMQDSDTVDDLKQNIKSSQISMPVEQQKLLLNGRLLEDGHLLSAYSIEENSLLTLVRIRKITLKVFFVSSSETITIDKLYSSDDLFKLKCAIQEQKNWSIDWSNFDVKLGSTPLVDDSRTLEEKMVHDGDQINVVQKR
eukprot:TRINITY_DN21564_c0_g2_i1.p1 TRINITY_DN21564_c0_g2~~TRINITY_DN21564_c0_g2_i1.p1  ORF type:complete len:272 (+),score=30.66 TRINITY_DN21564_c0_g2_i1:76-816(+)